jgi:hypothetical protein
LSNPQHLFLEPNVEKPLLTQSQWTKESVSRNYR